MNSLVQTLLGALSKDDRVTAGGALMRDKTIELALKLDPDLIRLLLELPRRSGH